MRRRSQGVVLPPARAETEEPWPSRWTPRGVTAALEPLVAPARRERIRSVLADRLVAVTVVMDAPHDPHNGGAVLRSCDAFGVQELHVVPREEPFAISTTVTRGSEKWVDLVKHPSVPEAVETLRNRGYELVATHPRGSLVPEDLAKIPKLALVLGNEHDGIREELERAASRTVRVPMRGFVESLNLSVSAALLLRAATAGRPGDLPEPDRERLYARGLYKSVPRADRVLAAMTPG
ncbi:MAG TPA: RNA methyltransferase [Polyangiaceae bacterium]|nr:RNA methyltransferase [Polyangiaceae bacterium]